MLSRILLPFWHNNFIAYLISLPHRPLVSSRIQLALIMPTWILLAIPTAIFMHNLPSELLLSQSEHDCPNHLLCRLVLCAGKLKPVTVWARVLFRSSWSLLKLLV